jgi:peptide-methionine (R)-S-oxide reductase
MMTRRKALAGFFSLAASSWAFGRVPGAQAASGDHVERSDEEWRKILSPEQYSILRKEGTERAFTSPLLHEERHGVFACAGCDLDLFSSETKFDSGTGWPSFWKPLDKAVLELTDHSYGMTRTAVNCRRCDGHLGHVFDDGPKPTGLRYCMNGLALKFRAA